METLRPRLQSGDGCADGAADARSAGGALAWHQLIDRLLLRKRGPLPPVCASRTTDGPRREPRVAAAATAEALVADGQDSVPHADRPATYIPLAKAPHNERNIL